MRETSRDYAHPYRRLPMRVLNAVAVGPLRASLDAEGLLAAARRAERLEDFGDPDPLPVLRRLVESLESEARLNGMGRWIARIRLVDGLRARLRVEALIAAHPEIAQVELAPPIVIAGLQRTGTTLLHRLLATAPGARAMRSWEALNPAPFRQGRDPDARITHAERGAKAVLWMAPDFFAVHPIDARAPEEEVVLLEQSLYSTAFEATMRMPSWAAWLEQQDQTPGYRYLRRALKALQWLEPGDHWVLKTPHHLEWMDTLFEVFPEARVVMTHRDPLQTQASFCSMVAHGRGLTSDEVDPHEVGEEWLRKCHRLLTRALETRDRVGEERFLDVRYDALVADPVATVEAVHRFAGLPWDDEVAAEVRRTREASPKHQWGRHVYAAEDFGLSDARVAETYADYRQRFGFDG